MLTTERKFWVVNLRLYLIVLYASVFLIAYGLLGHMYLTDQFLWMAILGGLGFLWVFIYVAVMLYRLWAFVIDESRKAQLAPTIKSPGAALGRLFIPFYNFYWVFVCLRGLPRDLAALATKRGLTYTLSTGLGTAIAALCFFGLIPFVNFVISPIVILVLYPMYFYQVAEFARNLKIQAETGRDLFIADRMAREKLVSTRKYGEFFSGHKTDYALAGTFFLGLLAAGLELVFWCRAPFIVGLSLFGKDLILAVMLVALSQWLRRAWLVTIGWTLVYALVSAREQCYVLGWIYGYGPSDFNMEFVRFLLLGLPFMGLLLGLMRIGGVRWWTVFPACLVASVLSMVRSGVGDKGVAAVVISGLWGALVLSAAVYGGFYLMVKLRVEKQLSQGLPAP